MLVWRPVEPEEEGGVAVTEGLALGLREGRLRGLGGTSNPDGDVTRTGDFGFKPPEEGGRGEALCDVDPDNGEDPTRASGLGPGPPEDLARGEALCDVDPDDGEDVKGAPRAPFTVVDPLEEALVGGVRLNTIGGFAETCTFAAMPACTSAVGLGPVDPKTGTVVPDPGSTNAVGALPWVGAVVTVVVVPSGLLIVTLVVGGPPAGCAIDWRTALVNPLRRPRFFATRCNGAMACTSETLPLLSILCNNT